MIYGKCPKILYTEVSDKKVYANSADPDQTAPQGLHCLPFYLVHVYFRKTHHRKAKIQAKNVWN